MGAQFFIIHKQVFCKFWLFILKIVECNTNFHPPFGKQGVRIFISVLFIGFQITCQSIHEIPPLMGMSLTKLSVVLSQGFRYRKVLLGFSTNSHNISRGILPEKSVVIDSVVNIYVYDWWHPRYPPFDNKLPSYLRDEESLPVLKKDFFNIREGEL